jgi:hypothetical protein
VVTGLVSGLSRLSICGIRIRCAEHRIYPHIMKRPGKSCKEQTSWRTGLSIELNRTRGKVVPYFVSDSAANDLELKAHLVLGGS